MILISSLLSVESLFCSDESDFTVFCRVQRQAQDGGFQGRINKSADTCYAFWYGKWPLHILSLFNMFFMTSQWFVYV